MRHLQAILSALAFSLACAAAPAVSAQAPPPPLDPLDGTPRDVFVHLENSSDLAVVGQSFGQAYPATYSAQGQTGTLTISAETHAQMLSGGFQPILETFTPIVIEFDLSTFEVTSQPASGAVSSGPVGALYSLNALDTLGLAGFMGPDVPAFFCSSQADVDRACGFVAMFCGQTCTIVPGAPYDPLTGLANLVGIETQQGCDGSFCSGPFDFFTDRGDLMITEASRESGGGNGSPCFVATAAYGTPLAAELHGLRRFRDHQLLTSRFGAAFTDAYYRLGAPLAEILARHDALRTVARKALSPAIRWCSRPAEGDRE